MKLLITTAFLFSMAVYVNGQWEWAYSLSGSDQDIAWDMTTDNTGNLIAVGEFHDTVDFDPGAGVEERISNGSSDFFVQKVDPNGMLIWVIAIGGSDFDIVYDVEVDSQDNIYVSGYFKGTSDFDPSGATYNLTTGVNTSPGVFIAKYDANGNFLWAKVVNSNSFDYDTFYPPSIEVNANDLICVGRVWGIGDIDPGPDTVNYDPGSWADIFVLKLDLNGNTIWTKALDGSGSKNIAYSSTSDDVGAVFLTGYFSGTLDADPGVGVNMLTATNSGNSLYLIKLSSSGDLIWAKTLESNDNSEGALLSAFSGNTFFLTGFFAGSADFDLGTGTNMYTANGNYDLFICEVDTSGTIMSVNTIISGDQGSIYLFTLDSGSDGTFNLGGAAVSSIYDPYNVALSSSSGGDGYWIRLNSSGAYETAELFNTQSGDPTFVSALSSYAAITAYVAVAADSAIDFDIQGTTTTFTVPNNISDAIIAKRGYQLGLEQETIDEFLIFPNPATNGFTISGNGINNAQIYLYDGIGVKHEVEKLITADTVQCTTDNLCTGVYFLEIHSMGRKIIKRVMIK